MIFAGGVPLKKDRGRRGDPDHDANCNAYAERFVLSIESECLNRMVFFGERRSIEPLPPTCSTITKNGRTRGSETRRSCPLRDPCWGRFSAPSVSMAS